MTIDNAGNVGIGTTNPLQKLQVAGDINIESGSGVRINNTATSGYYLRGDGTRFVSSAIQAGDLPAITAAGGWTDDGTVVRLTTATDQVGIGYTSMSAGTGLAISGNVGIGTTSPSQKLDVVGVAEINGQIQSISSVPSLFLKETGANADFQLAVQTDGRFSIHNDNQATEVVTILQSGNVGIGTTTPATKLHIEGNDVNSVQMQIINNATTGTWKYFGFNVMGPTAYGIADWPNATVLETAVTGGIVMSSYGGPTILKTGSSRLNRMVIDTSGNMGLGGT